MASELSHFEKSDPLTAERLNGVIDAINALTRNDRPPHDAGTRAFATNHDEVWIRNDTGAAIKIWQVVGIDDTAVIKPTLPEDGTFYPSFVLSAVTPDPEVHKSRFVVSKTAIAAGAIGPAIVSGRATVRLSTTSTTDRFAALTDASGKLTTGATGVPILLPAAATGAGVGVVLLGGSPPPVLPSGQYIGQQYQVVADNVSGFEFVTFTTLPE